MKRYIKSAVRSIKDEPLYIQLGIYDTPRISDGESDERIKQLADDMSEDGGFDKLVRIVSDPNTSSNIIRKIYRNHIIIDPVFVNHPNTPTDVLEDIYEHTSSARLKVKVHKILRDRGVI